MIHVNVNILQYQDFISQYQNAVVKQCLALSPHNKKFLGLNVLGDRAFCVDFEHLTQAQGKHANTCGQVLVKSLFACQIISDAYDIYFIIPTYL